MYLPLLWGFCVGLFFWYALLYVHSSFAIILTRKKELVALLLLYFGCFVTVNVLWLFLTLPWAGLQCVIVVFPDHTYLLFHNINPIIKVKEETFHSQVKSHITINSY